MSLNMSSLAMAKGTQHVELAMLPRHLLKSLMTEWLQQVSQCTVLSDMKCPVMTWRS